MKSSVEEHRAQASLGFGVEMYAKRKKIKDMIALQNRNGHDPLLHHNITTLLAFHQGATVNVENDELYNINARNTYADYAKLQPSVDFKVSVPFIASSSALHRVLSSFLCLLRDRRKD